MAAHRENPEILLVNARAEMILVRRSHLNRKGCQNAIKMKNLAHIAMNPRKIIKIRDKSCDLL